jgi:hypothetical protein
MWSRNCLTFRNILVFGQLRKFVVSHGLFLQIQGGQAINISEGYILPYWKELSTQQLLSLFIRKNLSNKNQDIFLLMSKTNKKKSENDYKCCKLEIYKGQLRKFVVSHGLFLQIQGGQAVFIFI